MKRALLLILVLACACGLAAPVFGATARGANGLMLAPSNDAEPNASFEASPLGSTGSGPGYTGIDDLSPCYFLYTVPLTKTWYKSYGIQFKGPNANDGGAVLDECGQWSITGYSGPNILAFNCQATMSNGGKPIGPETLMFSPAVDAVQLSIGSGADVGAIVEVSAKNADGGNVASQTVTLASSMQTVFLQGTKKIKKVVIGGGSSNACVFAVDNMFWGTPE